MPEVSQSEGADDVSVASVTRAWQFGVVSRFLRQQSRHPHHTTPTPPAPPILSCAVLQSSCDYEITVFTRKSHLSISNNSWATCTMDASLASMQARLATFQSAPAAKTRRTSSRSKKAAPKAKAAWPLAAPSAQDLAYAGFVWKPTTVSPDNVQCYYCSSQLDGWEETDVPAFEHLTHSPNCGYAIVACIRLRNGDPGRTEEDPNSDAMVAARAETFGNSWPLDTSAGYPSVEQIVAAGWYYDPFDDAPDGVTCPYCSLSLDAWDAGDDPTEEHRRRASDCLFFALTELYKEPPKPAPAKKGKRASTKGTTTKAKRASSRTSTASTTTKKTRTSTASTTTKKATRGKKRASEAVEEPEYSEVLQPPPKRFRSSSFSSLPDDLPVGTPKKTPTQLSDSGPASFEMSSLPMSLPVGTPKKTPSHLAASGAASLDISSFPPSLAVGTPKKTPSHMAETGVADFEMSSLPASLLVGTPKKTPPMRRDDEGQETEVWQPTDLETFFANQTDVRGFLSNVIIDAGLDDIALAGATPEELYAAVLAGLTDQEKSMTIEQWVLYNAKRGEEKLRAACENQILAFEAEGSRAMALLESIPTM